jgi:CheY-like chemotaxis protein
LRDEAPAQTRQPVTQARWTDNAETILVVEDQAPVRHLAVLTLREHGYRVLEAPNGEDALRLALMYDGPIHLLLTDLVMPRMTGEDLVQRMKSERPEIKVLFMSGYSADMLAQRGLMQTEWAFIAKPFPPDALALRIRELLGPSQASGSILVVDDEESVRGFFYEVLTGAGYDVAVASDGSEALAMIRQRPFDLLLTDLVMPEREGLELIMTLRNERPKLRTIAVSGAFGGTFLEAAKALGASAVLLKPVSPDRLLETVQQALCSRL